MRDSFRDSPKVSEGYFYTVALQAVKGFHLGACGMQPDAVFFGFYVHREGTWENHFEA